MTERACLPEPPCDWLIFTSWPVLPFQYFANAALKSTYSSRVGSYDTLSSVTESAACAVRRRPVTATIAASAAAPIHFLNDMFVDLRKCVRVRTRGRCE